LVQAVDTVKTLESTVAGVGDTVASSVPVVDSVATLLGEQLPATIQTTQKTLESVAASSETIDELLAVMSAIPFLGVDAYAPEVPLSQGFLDVAAGLEGIPESLQTTREQLLTMNESLAGLEGGFDAIAENVGQIATSVGSAHTVLQEYGGVIDQLKSSVGWMSKALPTWVKYLRLGVSALLIWLGIAQFALITQGWELIGRSRRREPEAATTG
jgi:methyl-accepting chemotaxis protein